jgi:hypothetical protein
MPASSFLGIAPKLMNPAASGGLSPDYASQGLTPTELFQIAQLGRHMDGTPWSLTELMLARDRHAGAYAEAVRAVGAQSGAARLNGAAVARLDELIQEKRTPHGVAKENLGKVLQRAKDDPRQASDKDLKAAVAEVLDTTNRAYAAGASAPQMRPPASSSRRRGSGASEKRPSWKR